jgi:hypothetical protein
MLLTKALENAIVNLIHFHMKKLVIFFKLLTLLIHNEAKCDNIVIKGVTFRMIFFSPFNNYPGIANLRDQLKDYSTNCTEDGCTFLSTWNIVNNRLMLAKIENCECNEKKQTANLKTLFGNRLQKGMLFAGWYTGEIWVTKDQPNSWGEMFPASWPSETRLIVRRGVIISIKNFLYPKPIERVYYKNTDSLNKFIYSHINWNIFHNLPQQSNGSYFRFEQDASGYLINIKQDKYVRTHEIFDEDELKEVSRVAELLQWPLYYYHGRPVRRLEGIRLVLSKEMQDKFTKQD